jgi:hypothetical protein
MSMRGGPPASSTGHFFVSDCPGGTRLARRVSGLMIMARLSSCLFGCAALRTGAGRTHYFCVPPPSSKGLALLSALLLAAGEAGSRAEYVGGTLAALGAGAEGRVSTVDAASFEFRSRPAMIRIPYERINLLEYGQNVSRRYALAILISPVLILSKKRAHFLTVGYLDDEGRQQALVLRLDKSSVRAVLASLEARTGQKIQFQDEEARKAGRG